ncbi:reductase, partial [Streptomyces sp. T21Q-yed]|nr:reductase [Streptomyces sp. T21Q-yed]
AVLARVAGYGGALHELDGPPGPLRPSIGHPRADSDHMAHATHSTHAAHAGAGAPVAYPDGCGSWQQADVRTARDRLGWRPRINLEESLGDIWMEAACRI